MNIIGITGKNASGKDTLADYLRDKHGFINYSLSNEIRAELTNRGLIHSRENLIMMGNEIREKFEANELALRISAKIKKDGTEKVVVTSIRNPAEIEELKKNFPNFKMIFMDAPIKLRYERSKARGKIAEGDTLEAFASLEERELAGGEKEQQLLACAKLADFSISNDGALEELQNKVENIFSQI